MLLGSAVVWAGYRYCWFGLAAWLHASSAMASMINYEKVSLEAVLSGAPCVLFVEPDEPALERHELLITPGNREAYTFSYVVSRYRVLQVVDNRARPPGGEACSARKGQALGVLSSSVHRDLDMRRDYVERGRSVSPILRKYADSPARGVSGARFIFVSTADDEPLTFGAEGMFREVVADAYDTRDRAHTILRALRNEAYDQAAIDAVFGPRQDAAALLEGYDPAAALPTADTFQSDLHAARRIVESLGAAQRPLSDMIVHDDRRRIVELDLQRAGARSTSAGPADLDGLLGIRGDASVADAGTAPNVQDPKELNPDALGRLTELRSLDLSGQPIAQIPSTIEKLERLQYLWLADTPLAGMTACADGGPLPQYLCEHFEGSRNGRWSRKGGHAVSDAEPEVSPITHTWEQFVQHRAGTDEAPQAPADPERSPAVTAAAAAGCVAVLGLLWWRRRQLKA